MTKRTRLFIWISAGVIVLGLGTGLVASYAGRQGLTIIGANGPDELAYVPHDVRLVGFANVRAVMDSDIRRKLEALQPDGAARSREFEEKTGVNLESDINSLVFALAQGPQAGPPLALARGQFDQVRLEGLMREHGAEVSEYNGTRLITVRGNQEFAVAFAEPDLLAFGGADTVRRALDTKSGNGPNITSNAEVMDIVRDMDDGNAWAVGRFDALPVGSQLPKDVAGQLPPITWFAAKGHVASGVDGVLRADASSEQAANDLREVIRGFMALARLQTGQNPAVASLLDTLQLGGEGKTVSLGFSLPAEAIDALAAMRRARPDRPAPNADRPQAQVF